MAGLLIVDEPFKRTSKGWWGIQTLATWEAVVTHRAEGIKEGNNVNGAVWESEVWRGYPTGWSFR